MRATRKRRILVASAAAVLAAGIVVGLGCCRKNRQSLSQLEMKKPTILANGLKLPVSWRKTLSAAYPGLNILQVLSKIYEPSGSPKDRHNLVIEYEGLRMMVSITGDGRLLSDVLPIPPGSLPPEVRAALDAALAKKHINNARIWWVRSERHFQKNSPLHSFTRFYSVDLIKPDKELLAVIEDAGGGNYKVSLDERNYSRWKRKPVSALKGKPRQAIIKRSPDAKILGCRYRYKDKTHLFWVQALEGDLPVHVLVNGKGEVLEMEDLRRISIKY